MRLHTNTLNTANLNTAARDAGVTVVKMTHHKSQTRVGAFELRLSGSSPRNAMRSDYKAATWDEWGLVLAALYALDPDMVVNAGTYLSADHFHWVTAHRFDTTNPGHATVEGQHKVHSWELSGTAATGSYYVYECRGCNTLMRRIADGYTWAEINR